MLFASTFLLGLASGDKNARIYTKSVNSPDGSLIKTNLNREFSLKDVHETGQTFFFADLSKLVYSPDADKSSTKDLYKKVARYEAQ